MYCFYVVFLLDLKKIVDSSKCFFICHWLCAIPKLYVMWFVDIFSRLPYFHPWVLRNPVLLIFFSTISTSCAQDESLKEMQTKISTILYREKTLNFIDQCYY